jgi:hypothetical protein
LLKSVPLGVTTWTSPVDASAGTEVVISERRCFGMKTGETRSSVQVSLDGEAFSLKQAL